MPKKRVSASALNKCDQRTFAAFADDKIAFPVPRHRPVVGFWAALGDLSTFDPWPDLTPRRRG